MKMKTHCLLMVAVLCCVGTVSLAQTPKDTLNLRDKHFMRQAAYEANQESFAPPRRNNASIGFNLGPAMIAGDIRPEFGFGFGLNVRKAISHAFSLRLTAGMGTAKGLNWRANGGFARNSALNGAVDSTADYTTLTYPYVYYNFKTNYTDLGLQGVFNIGNISFHNREPKVGFYLFAGLGAMLYNTRVNALDANGAVYDYEPVDGSQTLSEKRDILDNLYNLLDDDFETAAEEHVHKPKMGDNTFLVTGQVGFGLDFKLSRRVDLMLEYRLTWSGDDLLDGHRWEETLTLTANSDYLTNATVGLNFRLGKGEESYWFQNPLTTIYNDVRDLKRFNKSGEKDTDNDGVVDSRDKEPGTPEGVLVDAQGRAIDSDGDGIQDFRDKEPFSPKGAEVDRSGVAVDSDNDGVIDFYDEEPNSVAGSQADAKGMTIEVTATEVEPTPAFEMVNFELGKATVEQEYFPTIYEVARYLNNNPTKKVIVVGNADVRGKSKRNEELSRMRADNVANILINNFGISKDRVKVDYKGSSELLVKLPGVYDPNNESLHFLNRRVEFVITD
jgi:outer membrane protein OmpA-like peptidoglycan-associated protein